jgi:acyl-CoA reductase-like NAD-dependent aldehyde dehydrogenase
MSRMEARNPRTGQIDYTFEAASPQDVQSACAKARAAQRRWHEGGLAYRIEIMKKLAAALHEHAGAIVEALTVDTGRRRISVDEVDAVCHFIHGYAEHAPRVFAPVTGKSSHVPDVQFQQQYVPYPVVGVISPWNFPMVLSFFDAVAALFAGCAVVIKPSEVTPRFVDPLKRAIDSVPELAGVITLLRGGAETGSALIANVDLIVFTGSIPTGRKVAAAAALHMIPCFLELGGKDPAVVLAGADLERAAVSIIRSAVYNTGQVCYAIERVYVDEKEHDELVRLLVEKCKTLDINYPDPGNGAIGPFIFERQADIVMEQLRDAQEKGARILCGGEVEVHGGGLWMRPTVVDNVDHRMRLMREETFGPVIPVMTFRTVDEAVELANDTEFGLSGAVFAPTLEQGTAVAARIDAGGMSINDTELPRTVTFDAEKMAFRYSGMGGSRYGAGTMMRYVRKKALICNAGAVKPLTALEESGG